MKKYILLLSSILLVGCSGFSSVSETSLSRYQLPELEDIVIYQVNPRVFTEEHPFRAISFYLDSIKQLGANVIWFMPIHEIGKEKSVNSPYCVRDYRSVNAEFGTIEEFRELVRGCHEKEVGVIIDWVPNHTAWDHPWIENTSWYTQNDQGEIIWPEGTNWRDVANLNYDNMEMRLAMIEAMKYWITDIGIDGFRCDAVDYVPADFLRQANDTLLGIPDTRLLLLAEGKRPDHFESGFQLNYGWDFHHRMRQVFLKEAPAASLFEVHREEYADIPAGKHKLRFSTNHDETAGQSPVQEWNGKRGSMAAFVISAFMPGCPMIYSSQEVGYPDKINFFYPTPIDWSMNQSLREEYKRLMAVYHTHEPLRRGELHTYPDDHILLFERRQQDRSYLIAVNVRNDQQSVPVPVSFAGRSFQNLCTVEEGQLPEQFLLDPYQYLILEIR
ncbi:MAG: alpha-amylase [Tannerellaceae bacterium]|nr:alpha-amylase [Tannerellaceae bacterium]